jgi:hypothetical protein
MIRQADRREVTPAVSRILINPLMRSGPFLKHRKRMTRDGLRKRFDKLKLTELKLIKRKLKLKLTELKLKLPERKPNLRRRKHSRKLML